MDNTHIASVVAGIIVVILLYIVLKENLVVSRIDGKKYNVKDFENSQEAADILAQINANVVKLISHLKRKYDKTHPLVKNLLDRFNPDVINEHIPTIFDSQVAYTRQKGQSLYICLRTLFHDENNLHKMNIIMFVALHEISHIATDVKNHPDEFWEVFKFILTEAIEINIYIPENYRKNNARYCESMVINYNPLFDMSLDIWKPSNQPNNYLDDIW